MPDLIIPDRRRPYPDTKYWQDPDTGAVLAYVRVDGPLAVSGPLTDAQLRAAAVPVSGSAPAGSAPTLPPLSVSGLDANGIKRHLLTDPTGAQVIAGKTAVITATPVVSTTAYAAGDVVGAKMTFAGAVRAVDYTGLLQMVTVFCKTAQSPSLDLILFHTDPTNSAFVDNAALAVAVADFDKLIGVVHLTDWSSLGTPSIAQADNLAKPFKPAIGSADIYGVLVTRSVMTLASVSDIKVALKFLQD